jgi:DNA uptake protein ComE-like DNA-binding protein
MNQFLKAVIKEAFDAEALVVDVVAKAWTKLLQDAVTSGMDAVSLAGTVSSAKAELEALLADPSADADLLAYVVGLSAGLGDAKAQAIVAASAKLALDVVVDCEALVAAVKQQPVVAPAPTA